MERIRATNACIRPADDMPSLFIDGKKCPTAVDSARKWRMHRGRPSRTEKAAHFGDVLGYAVWRFFPRRGAAKKLLDSEALPREQTEGSASWQGVIRWGGDSRRTAQSGEFHGPSATVLTLFHASSSRCSVRFERDLAACRVARRRRSEAGTTARQAAAESSGYGRAGRQSRRGASSIHWRRPGDTAIRPLNY
jgi:hypothetical protein